MVANQRNLAGWNYPTQAMLRGLLKGQKPTLRIDALQRRLLGSQDCGVWKAVRRRHETDDPSWLPDPDVEFHIPCQVNVSVVDARSPKRVIFTQLQAATAIGRRGENGSLYCDIELESPYLIELDKLFVVMESGTNGSRHWKRTATVEYHLEVSIHCRLDSDIPTLLGQLESRDVSDYRGAPPIEGVLKAAWEKLPDCPKPGSLLLVKRPKGHKSLEIAYGLDISMGWCRRAEAPLKVWNRLQNPQGSQQLPTPSASDDLERASKRVRVQYEFEEGLQTRTHSTDHLRCLFCESKREYDNVVRLLLHYKLHHEHFHLEPSAHEKGDEEEKITIVLSLAEKPTISHASTSEKEVHHEWVAPDRPFDIAAHIGGDERWTGGSRGKVSNKRGRPPKARDTEHTNGHAVSGASKLPTQALRLRQNLEDIRDLPQPGHKKHSVPVVPEVTFYHTKSKQSIEPGETISEDEEEGVDWRLAESQIRSMREHGLSHMAADFHAAFNQHLDTEQSASRTLVREAIVRFARKYEKKIRMGWQPHFDAKLRHLQAHGVVGADVVAYCVSMGEKMSGEETVSDKIGHATTTTTTTTTTIITADLDDGDVEMTDAPEQSTTGEKPRCNGRYAKHPAEFPGQNTPSSSAKKPKKPHRWMGGGADRDIIGNGIKQFFPKAASDAEETTGGDRQSASKYGRQTTTASETPPSTSRAGKHARIKSKDAGASRSTEVESGRSQCTGFATPLLDRPNGRTRPTNGASSNGAAKLALTNGETTTKGRCVCGATAEGGKGCVACENAHCVRGDFHMACVGLERRVMGWRCGECLG